MKYGILSSLEYSSGRIILFCSRFDNVSTGNNEQSPEFCRSCLQWVSGKSEDDLLSVLIVSSNEEDTGYRVFYSADKVNVQRAELDDLSDELFLSRFDSVCFFGVNNNLSPIIKLSLKSYVESGGGLILADINVDSANIDLLEDIAPVYCQSSGVNFSTGKGKWTSVGVESPIYEKEFSHSNIQILNTISEFGLSAYWDLLYVYDTSTDVADEEDLEEIVDGPVYLSSDYDIAGDRIVGYFSGVYKDGILSANENV